MVLEFGWRYIIMIYYIIMQFCNANTLMVGANTLMVGANRDLDVLLYIHCINFFMARFNIDSDM